MGKLLAKYKGHVAEGVLDSIQDLARRLSGRSVLHVHTGRLRADITASLARLGDHFEDLGIQHRETTIVGTEDLFDIARLAEEQAPPARLAKPWLDHYREVMRLNAEKTFLSSDIVMVHGLQPLGMIDDHPHDCPWLWRCYADLVGVAPAVGALVRRYIANYQGVIFSHPSFVPELAPPCFIIPPSIDPFSAVNESMGAGEVSRVLDRIGVPSDRPLALQFLGANCASESLEAIRAWKCSLVPENAVLVLIWIDDGPEIPFQPEMDALRKLDRNVRVLHLSRACSRELCALGWAAQVVIDPTNSRWPSLDLLDVMWKSTPALVSCDSATAPFIRNECGYRVRSRAELSRRLRELLEDSKSAKDMGACAHLSIGRHHIIPRHLLDYLQLVLHFVESQSHA